jgi:3-hydroxybutyryl-CoA dehydrogenase
MITTICVCGAGTMGTGIAQSFAQSGINTILYDLNAGMLEKARASINASLQTLAGKGKIDAGEQQAVMHRIRFTKNMNDCIAEIIVEAIAEHIPSKVALFNQLAELNHSETIFATNTSSLSVTSIAEAVMHPSRVAGMHFFNPAPLMKLVEVVAAEQTAETVIRQLIQLTKDIGKVPVLCRDAPGFIVNRVARPYYLEALYLLEQGVADVETIDRILECSGFKMGPFRLMDLIGNDINLAVTGSVYNALGQPLRLKPSRIQEQKVAAAELGRKTKKGYYNYPA